MIEVPETPPERLTLHFVGSAPSERAQFAKAALEAGHHCELYDDFAELSAHPPRRGIIFLSDRPEDGGIPLGIDRLEKLGIWLTVIAVGQAPTPDRIVTSVKSGALDYIVLPVEPERLKRCVARNLHEAERNEVVRRNRMEARERLDRLSQREAEVLTHLANGCSNKLIARELGISPRTVEIHRANMLSKIGASNSAGALRLKLNADGF